jgi:hypothetical protein
VKESLWLRTVGGGGGVTGLCSQEIRCTVETVFFCYILYTFGYIYILFNNTVSNSDFIKSEEKFGRIVKGSGHGLT